MPILAIILIALIPLAFIATLAWEHFRFDREMAELQDRMQSRTPGGYPDVLPDSTRLSYLDNAGRDQDEIDWQVSRAEADGMLTELEIDRDFEQNFPG